MARFPPRPRYILDIMLHLVRPSGFIEILPSIPSRSATNWCRLDA
jgi:hypothetical protein